MDLFLDIVRESLKELYCESGIAEIISTLESSSRDPVTQPHTSTFSERDAVLISYADSIFENDQSLRPLQSLARFLETAQLTTAFPVLHLLPFFPWDTDRGFSVADFYSVAEENGLWEDVHALGHNQRLMFDFVANHASITNPLVQGALIARHLSPLHPLYPVCNKYRDFVLAYTEDECPTEAEIAALSRPRAAPVLTPYYVRMNSDGAEDLGSEGSWRDRFEARLGLVLRDTVPIDAQATEYGAGSGSVIGSGFVWTTFSRGQDAEGNEQTKQVDLNYKNPKVFLEALKIVLFYAQQRASWIRLDAIGYLWKNPGSSSLHEVQTHKLLAAFHAALAYCAPELVTIAEVNEPQEKVFDYLGEPQRPEADLVYQFTHFPLAVHALLRKDLRWYADWLASSEQAEGRQFITVLGSHDGMGMKPLRGLLPEAEIQAFAQYLSTERGGMPNFARLPGGSEIVYEVCGTAWELINGGSADSFEQQLARYRVVIALGMMSRGVPAMYLQAVLGASNYLPEAGLDENRTVNRERFAREDLQQALSANDSRTSAVVKMITHLLEVRSSLKVFDARGSSLRIHSLEDPRVLAVSRSKKHSELTMVVNVSPEHVSIGSLTLPAKRYRELLSGEVFIPEREPSDAAPAKIELASYGVHWLLPCEE